MTVTEPAPSASKRSYGIADSDQHIYESAQTLIDYMDPQYRNNFMLIEVKGRQTLMINDRLYRLIPNPTYEPVGSPGTMVEYFRGHNPEGKSLKELAGPPQHFDDAFRFKEPRMKVLDEQGIDFVWMLPTLALGLEEMMWETPLALASCARALNKWMHEEWTWNVDDRVHTAGVISFIDPGAAEAELKILLDQGCRLIGARPAPVKLPGIQRSIADPMYDRVYAMIAEAGAILGFHAADTGYGVQTERWGEGGRMESWKSSPLGEIIGVHTDRPVYDTSAALISHGVFERHPTLKVAMLELGAGWVPELFRKMRSAYGKMPQAFNFKDPVETFRNNVWVMPFYEDHLEPVADELGVDHLIYGSDWPHPEGFADPKEYFGDLAGFSDEDTKKIMRDNLLKLALGK
ncbi:MAG: amidohydrolase family protein [Actinomycetota bacterium]|nr:amidohydrolase family protein [Actinomycetota bacterium]